MANIIYDLSIPKLGMKDAFALGLPRMFFKALSSAKLPSEIRDLQIFRQELPDPHIELFTRDYLLYTFHVFNKLPTELRLKIWTLIPRKRTIVACVDKYKCLRSLSPSPVAFYVNRESRLEIQRHYPPPYTLASYPAATPQPALHQHHFDPNVDTVHVTAQYFMPGGDFMELVEPEPAGQGPMGDPENPDAASQHLIFDGDDEPRQRLTNSESLSIIQYLELEMDLCWYIFGTKHGAFEHEYDDEGAIEFFHEIANLRRIAIIRDWTYETEEKIEVVRINMAKKPSDRHTVYYERCTTLERNMVRMELGNELCGDWAFTMTRRPENQGAYRLRTDPRQ
jgi:hypothetical protein